MCEIWNLYSRNMLLLLWYYILFVLLAASTQHNETSIVKMIELTYFNLMPIEQQPHAMRWNLCCCLWLYNMVCRPIISGTRRFQKLCSSELEIDDRNTCENELMEVICPSPVICLTEVRLNVIRFEGIRSNINSTTQFCVCSWINISAKR